MSDVVCVMLVCVLCFIGFATPSVWRRSPVSPSMSQVHGLELNCKKTGCFSRIIIANFSKLGQHYSESAAGHYGKVLYCKFRQAKLTVATVHAF